MIRELVRRPDAFMEEKVGGIRLRWEIALLILIGGFGSVGAAWAGLQIVEFGVSESANFVIIGKVLNPILGVIGMWIGYSVAIHWIANQFGGRGPIRRILKLTPYAMLPVALGNAAKSAALYWLFEDTLDLAVILEDTPFRPTDAVLAAAHEELLFAATVVLGIFMLVWTAYLLSFAVKHAKNVPHEDALRVAAVPVGIHVLWIIWGLLGTFGVV